MSTIIVRILRVLAKRAVVWERSYLGGPSAMKQPTRCSLSAHVFRRSGSFMAETEHQRGIGSRVEMASAFILPRKRIFLSFTMATTSQFLQPGVAVSVIHSNV